MPPRSGRCSRPAHPYGTGGAYPNFPEPGLSDTAYYGANTDRVHRIRAAYDPDGVFTRQHDRSSPVR
jgi:Berberine and berberine like